MAEFDERDIVSAEANPKTHRPLFRQGRGKVWRAVKKTAHRTLVVNPKKLLPETAALEHIPSWDVYSIASTIFGAFGTGFSGAGIMLGVDAVATALKVNTAAPWYAPVRDTTRLVGEGILGLKIYPWLGKELTGDTNVGKALWLGGTVLTGIDLGVTVFKYVAQAVNMVQTKSATPPAAEPAEQTAGMALMGLSGLGALLKGVTTVEPRVTSETAPTVEGIGTNVYQYDGVNTEDEAFLVGELQREQQKFSELSTIIKGEGTRSLGSLMKGFGGESESTGGKPGGRLNR
jgi:hypothetical protein